MQKEWKQMFPLKSFKNKKRTLKIHLTLYVKFLKESLQNIEKVSKLIQEIISKKRFQLYFTNRSTTL